MIRNRVQCNQSPQQPTAQFSRSWVPPVFHPERTGILGPIPHMARGDSTKSDLETTESGARAWLEPKLLFQIEHGISETSLRSARHS